MRGALDHPSPPAARTEGPALARERQQAIGAAARAPKPGEPARETATREELTELALDKLREAMALAPRRSARAEGLEVIADYLMQDLALGLARPVLRRGHGPAHRKAGARTVRIRPAMRVNDLQRG
jgi:hypothetical protein